MNPRPPLLQSPRDLRRLTPARVGLGRTGASLPTQALLDFTLDHARARDAVHSTFDSARLAAELAALGLASCEVSSRARGRRDYLVRPDLGRQLDPASHDALARRGVGAPCDLALMVGDGLSPTAVNARAVDVVRGLLPRLAAADLTIGVAAVATGARVALGDEIGVLLGARMVLVLIGERPGLSAPASMGAYLTFAPRPGITDAERNCVSNIHAAGISNDEAAYKIGWLLRESFARQISGVALKDDSALQARDLAPRRVEQT
ncbi:ethanolamine ammonia-lyase subunit EutC [Rhodopseudomonas palustris]|uniref:Ethanolamine ammonia-lyase small subunit n=1 Tax=Rhodopseudomonas palustris (strain BisB18) TaxID=316056 RepID=Q218B4_RHOPB